MLQMVFAQVAGPLTWSIVALRNSLVLHSLDKASCQTFPLILKTYLDSSACCANALFMPSFSIWFSKTQGLCLQTSDPTPGRIAALLVLQLLYKCLEARCYCKAPDCNPTAVKPSQALAMLQITSLFMHISPALVCWAWRWYPDPTKVRFDKMSAEQLKAYNTASWWDIGVLSMGTYMIWVVLYYLKVRISYSWQR